MEEVIGSIPIRSTKIPIQMNELAAFKSSLASSPDPRFNPKFFTPQRT